MTSQFVSVVAGRQHAIKAAEIHRASIKKDANHQVLDCGFNGRPYAEAMARQLGLPEPHYIVSSLMGDTSMSRADALTSEIVDLLGAIDVTSLIVYGDLLESVCAARAAVATGTALVHVEAGLRSFDEEDDEEHYRREIDDLASLFVTHSRTAADILASGGAPVSNILLAGSPAIATLRHHIHRATPSFPAFLDLNCGEYALATIHRLGTLRTPGKLTNIVTLLKNVANRIPVVLIAYGSTLQAMRDSGLHPQDSLIVVDTLDYETYLGVLVHSRMVITDSSGLQDETTYLGIPCYTLRSSTHRFGTITSGTNTLLPGDLDASVVDLIMITSANKSSLLRSPLHWADPSGEPILDFVERMSGAGGCQT